MKEGRAKVRSAGIAGRTRYSRTASGEEPIGEWLKLELHLAISAKVIQQNQTYDHYNADLTSNADSGAIVMRLSGVH